MSTYEMGVPIADLKRMDVVRLKSGERLDFLEWAADGHTFTALPMDFFAGIVVRRTRDIDRRVHGRAIKERARNPLHGIPMAGG